MPLLNPEVGVAQGAGGVIEQGLLLFGAHLPEPVARLLVVVVVDAMIPPGRVALYLERRLDKGLVSIHPRPLAVGPVGGLGAEIAIGPRRSEEHTSELQSLMSTSYAVFCMKKK